MYLYVSIWWFFIHDSQHSPDPNFQEVWRRLNSNPEKYFVSSVSAAIYDMFDTQIPAVVFKDYWSAVMKARRRKPKFCNWGMLKDRFLPLGYGMAFQQGSPYKPYFDKAWVVFKHDIHLCP